MKIVHFLSPPLYDYWSSTVNGSYSRLLRFGSGHAVMNSDNRAHGFSVRCLKD